MTTTRFATILGGIVLLSLVPAASAGELLTNGGFEAGVAGWTLFDQAGGSGSFFVQSGTGSPLNGFGVPAPPQGTNAAMTDQGGPGTHVLLQSFTVPLGSTSVMLSFQSFIGNQAAAFNPDSVDYTVIPNQQAIVDILGSVGGAFDNPSTAVVNAFTSTANGGYSPVSFDLTSFVTPGSTYTLRLAEVDNQLFFNAGFDDVSIQAVGAVPEPGSAVLLLCGVAALGVKASRRKR
jgi:hypothetical protein